MKNRQQYLAGKNSGRARGARTDLRRLCVFGAFEELDACYRHQPFSDSSVDALLQRLNEKSTPLEYKRTEGGIRFYGYRRRSDRYFQLLDMYLDTHGMYFPVLRAFKRETVKNDLKALGIRSTHKKRFG